MPSRNLKAARDAYREKDGHASTRVHDERAGEQHQQQQGKYLKSVVYGGLDGIITTFAVVAGVAGASLASGIVLILGFANLIADGLSMAIGDYLSTKAENEYHKAERAREQWEVENYPDGEKRELIDLYVERGMSEDDARAVVEIVSKHPKTWVDIMMVEELGIVESNESPVRNAVATFLAFGVFGFVPLAAYVIATLAPVLRDRSFPAAGLLTGATLFILGAVKVRITGRSWLRSGLEMLLVGGLAAFAAYGIGRALSGLA